MVIIWELVKTIQYQAKFRPTKAEHAFSRNPQVMCMHRVQKHYFNSNLSGVIVMKPRRNKEMEV